MRTSTPGDIYVNCSTLDIDVNGFTALVYRTNETDCLVDYFAVAPR
jgi:hypothetical protein